MAAINLRVGSILPLTNQQVDDNFQNLNNALGAAGSPTIKTPTGTGNPVLSISPSVTGTLNAVNITYTGGIIGGTSVVAIGTNQIYKDTSGNVGLGNVPSGSYKLEVTGNISATGDVLASGNVRVTGNVGIGGVASAVSLEVISTSAMLIPKGTTIQRPTGVAGYIRYNTTTLLHEGHNGTTWLPFIVDGDPAGTAVAMAIALG